jgi:hypothetical protein
VSEPYNPLDKINLARSIEVELLGRPLIPLSEAAKVRGAGVYAIYYAGDFPAYAPISIRTLGDTAPPIYVGKAIPQGGRKGGLTTDSGQSRALSGRLRSHATSVDHATNLELGDFWARYLAVDDIWIPLGENMLIQSFQPVWNVVIDGFGNNDPGVRRATQFRSLWDVIHPGRKAFEKLAQNPLDAVAVQARVRDFLAHLPVPRVAPEDQSGPDEA